MSETDIQPMTEQSLQSYLESIGAKVRCRSGRNEHYGSPREFSFEIKAIFDNGLGLQILARQYNYRDPWEAQGRVNDMIDISLLKDGSYTELPKGFDYFQAQDTEEEVEWETFCAISLCVSQVNPKIYLLQKLTGDL